MFGEAKIIKFNETVSYGSRTFPCVLTDDGHDKGNSLLRSFAKAPKEQKMARRISTEYEQVWHPTMYMTYHKTYMYEEELISP